MAKERTKRDWIAECLALKDFSAEDLATAFGKGCRIAQMKRRAGQALANSDELRAKVANMSLRDLLKEACKSIEGKEYDYANP